MDKNDDADSEALHLHQMEDAYIKHYAITEEGFLDLSWWRRASFGELCSEKLFQRYWKNHDDVTGYRFNYEEAKLAFPRFRKFQISFVDETNVSSSVIKFDDVVLDAVFYRILQNSLKQFLYYPQRGF